MRGARCGSVRWGAGAGGALVPQWHTESRAPHSDQPSEKKGSARVSRGTDKSIDPAGPAGGHVSPRTRTPPGGDKSTLPPSGAEGASARLAAESVTLGYDRRVIAENLSVAIPDRSFTVIVGPNACGKSTLLRALSRLLTPARGRVLLDGRAIGSLPAKAVARTLGLLPQSSVAPDGITVSGLVARGRYPHQGLLRQWSARGRADRRRVDGRHRDHRARPIAMSTNSPAASASGCGSPWRSPSRPRCCCSTSRPRTSTSSTRSTCSTCARTCTSSAAALWWRYCTTSTRPRATPPTSSPCGTAGSRRRDRPGEIITAAMVERVFGVRCRVIEDPESGTPLVVPAARRPAHRVRREGAAGTGPAAEGEAGAEPAEVTGASAAAARPAGSPAP